MTKYYSTNISMIQVTENDIQLERAIPLIGIEQGKAHDKNLPDKEDHLPIIAENFRNVIREGNVEIWRLEHPVPGAGAVFLSPLEKDGQKGIQIDDVVVMPEHRGKGLGSAMIQFTAALAQSRGLSFVTWECEENNPAQKAYLAVDAAPRKKVKPFRLTKDIILKIIQDSNTDVPENNANVTFTTSNRFSLFRTVNHGITDYDMDPEQKSFGLQIEDLTFDTIANAKSVLSHALKEYRNSKGIDFVDIVIPNDSKEHLELIKDFDAEQNSYSGNPAFLWELSGEAFIKAAEKGKQIKILEL